MLAKNGWGERLPTSSTAVAHPSGLGYCPSLSCHWIQSGLGIYLNGTDLPDETYRDCDMDVVYSEFNRLLTGIGSVHSH